MSTANPLVASAQDSTSAFSGTFLVQDADDIANAIKSGDWGAGALSVASGALDTVAAVIDPIGTLIANGLGWLIEHFEPLKGWFDDFTGDAADVAAFSGTWANASTHLEGLADRYQSSLGDLSDLSGATVDAYLTHANGMIAHLRGASTWAGAMSTGLQIASTLVQMVHDVVRDALSQVVGTAISATATAAITLGIGTPVALAQIGSKVASLVAKIGHVIPKIIDALTELKRLLGRLGGSVQKAVSDISRRLHGGAATHVEPVAATRRVPTRTEFETYRDSRPSREANYGKPAAREFQREHAGPTEYRIGPPGEDVWADGLRYDPGTGGVAVEAKYVMNPGGSAVYEGTAPAFVADRALTQFDDEITRYAAAISDSNTPLTRLDIVVSTPAARDFLSERVEQLFAQSVQGHERPIDWNIRVEGDGR
ncbi:hypothetical protein PU630_15415 [Microbacterium horticulturae]|uniref:Tox-REase-2 domain-containing protein n=1 Tax=Microbacterium horticulturae TaxID=3028316 RepID=A0ABY8C1V9_9MICO|nr:restriction endonuclease fold toxin-2 domain-containing protein [Microbacterium sp. KACC 23027]WEG08613.1 hypothetical protein PU630_15415 [Microbacterium sp. KACC 23027]